MSENRLVDVLEALVAKWWSEPDGLWAVNLSKRKCAEQLKAILDDPKYSIQIHLASHIEDASDETLT